MPKLPADLPENWTQGQTISPNGTEVGLTEKHGYNYLMKQVNDTQTEVNDINTALTDVAQQATVEEINNKIGEESDADTQPTLFGRLAQLKKVLVEKLAEVLTKVTGIDGKIGTSEDEAGSSTLFGYILSIYKGMSKKCVISKNKQFDVKFHQIRYNGDATLLMLNRVSDYDGSILIELTNDFSPSGDSKKFLWAFSESSLMVSSSDYSSTLKIKELISLPEGSQLSSKIWNFPIMRASGETPNTLYPVSFYKSNSENFYKQSFCLQVKKGERYFLIGGFESSYSGSTSFSASVYYDVKEV